MDIAEFLLARIAEDEAVARELDPNVDRSALWSGPEADTEHGFVGIDPSRVFAECEAKRAIVANWKAFELHRADDDRFGANLMADGLDYAVSYLALPYLDHPHYCDEWRP